MDDARCWNVERVVIEIRRSAIVKHSAQRMFALVNDVAAYPKRFSWCSGSRILEQDDTHLIARLELKFAGFTQSFTTRNSLEPPHRIGMDLVDGPFRELRGAWQFDALGDDGCKVLLALDFDYAGGFIAPLMRNGFQKLADRMVDEFCAEADRAYG
jgi:ribosome-associated toxin RatA of RatAB toxin-antitoxin module